MTRRIVLVPLLAAAFLLPPSGLSGQMRPASVLFEVSPRSYGSTEPGRYTTRVPTTAALADGSFVVAWGEDLEVTPPGEPSEHFFDLYARKIAATGRPGQLVRVDRGRLESVQTERRPRMPELAADGQGGFVLAWERLRSQGADVLFQAAPPGDFVHRGGELLHRPRNGRLDRSPAVAANAAGDWVIAWEEWQDEGGLRRKLGVRAFDASGAPATAEIRIESSDPAVALSRPRVAMQQDGSFMVVWGVFASGRTQKLQGRSFAADGTPSSQVIQISQGMNAWEVVNGDPASGEFLVAWHTDLGRPRILLRRYAPDGHRVDTVVLAQERGLRSNWRLASNHHGDLAFVWVDGSRGVRVRLLDAQGAPQGSAFTVAQVADDPWIGDLAISDTRQIFVVWIGPVAVSTGHGATHHPLLGQLWEVRGE